MPTSKEFYYPIAKTPDGRLVLTKTEISSSPSLFSRRRFLSWLTPISISAASFLISRRLNKLSPSSSPSVSTAEFPHPVTAVPRQLIISFQTEPYLSISVKEPPAPPVIYYWYLGQKCKLEVPQNYWPILLKASQETGTNPYLLAALADTESNWNPKVLSPAGAQGLFQFMPRTWKLFALKDQKRTDPQASALAAAKMLQKIGLAAKFDQAIAALVSNDSQKFTQARTAFLKSFTGADGSLCWNQHYGQAVSVFNAAVKLYQAASQE